MAKVRWGVLSTAKIGTEKVIPAMQEAKNCEIRAIASRDITAARKVGERLNIECIYGNYDALLDDGKIDAVYIPLPNHLHVPWTIKAVKAGKHVLCEKPIALTAEEAESLDFFCRMNPDIKVMEAFMYRFHPQWQKTKQMVDEGQIGTLKTIQSVFSYYNVDPQNIRNKVEIGGGGLMDIGCYCISLARYIFAAEPQRVLGHLFFDPDFNIDVMASAILDFAQGSATFTCSTQMAPFQRVNIFGSKGRIEIEIPFNAPSDRPCRIFYYRNDDVQTLTFPACNQYTIQAELFSASILDNTDVPTPLTDAGANMQIIDKIRKSQQTKGWVN